MSADPRRLARALDLLGRPGAYLDPAGGGYALRTGSDRRRRPSLILDEAELRALIRAPGLKPRPDGGYRLAVTAATAAPSPEPGRPGVIEGERAVAEADGAVRVRRANLGESPIAWLARRRDAAGRPWLSAAEVAAGERLREDHHRAGTLGRLTMSWDATPKGTGGRGLDPALVGLEAKRRIAAALEAVGPDGRAVLEAVCFAGSSLAIVERRLALPRRSGKTALKAALGRLAAHYGLA